MRMAVNTTCNLLHNCCTGESCGFVQQYSKNHLAMYNSKGTCKSLVIMLPVEATCSGSKGKKR